MSTSAAEGGNGSVERPYKSVAQAAKRAKKNDTINLIRGQVYREADISIEGASLIAAGPADQPPPVISGALAITGFKPLPENSKILAAACPQKPVMCAIRGQLLTLARFPNTGFLATQEGTKVDTLVDAELSRRGSSRWNDAQLHWRKWSWWWETRTVTADDGKSLQLSPTPVKDLAGLVGIGSAYYIDDCRAELDAPGEWYYDSSSKQLLLIPPDGATAASLVVDAVVNNDGLHLSNATVRGITLRHYAGSAIGISRTSTVEDCVIEQVWGNAVSSSWDAPGSTVRGCTISDILNTGIFWNENSGGPGGTVIEKNTFQRIGMRDGLGGSGTWHACGIIVSNGNAVKVRLNTMMDVGYCGIIMGHDGQIAEHNIFVRCMSTMNDGAAIYANCNASVIRENIVLNAIGNLWTSQPFYPLGHGIWPEFVNQYHDTKIIGNTVVGCGGNGIFMPNNFTCEIRDNVLAGNRLAGLCLGTSNNIRKPQQHKIENNIFISDTRMHPTAQQKENIPSNWMGNDKQSGVSYEKGIDYGSMTGSVFVTAQGTTVAKGQKDATAWKSDAAWADPSPRVVPTQAFLLINDTEQAFDFSVPSGNWATITGEHVGGVVHTESFHTAVLLSATPLPSNAPTFLLASGRDFAVGGEIGKATKKSAAKSATVAAAAQHSEAKPKPEIAVVQPKPEALTEFTKKLKENLATAIQERRCPKFVYSQLKSEVQLTGVDGTRVILQFQGSSMNTEFFAKLEPIDAMALSRALLRDEKPEEHALVAFFALCSGKHDVATEQLALAGAAATAVKAAFVQK